MDIKWEVELVPEFESEVEELTPNVRKAMFKAAVHLELSGPMLGRPYADTLKGSRHSNMKELRFSADDGEWRVAFAFDPTRHAVLLVAGDKAGVGQKRFYADLIDKADGRFDAHLERRRKAEKR